jgi:putative acetyltransferase
MAPSADWIVRCEHKGDAKERCAIRAINEAAFRRSDEADLVENLQRDGAVLLSVVAEVERQTVGHLLFSRMSIETDAGAVLAVALAPVAVLPGHQRRGIGEQMIRYGLEVLRRRGERIVIVLGHPDYYGRIGFSSEKARSLESPFPPEAYLALELSTGALEGIRGKVRYASAFGV